MPVAPSRITNDVFQAVSLCDVYKQSLVVQPGELYIPGWSGNGGINDRFAMLHPKTALMWKGRLEYTLTHCLERPIQSESFTRDYAQHLRLGVRPGLSVPRSPNILFLWFSYTEGRWGEEGTEVTMHLLTLLMFTVDDRHRIANR